MGYGALVCVGRSLGLPRVVGIPNVAGVKTWPYVCSNRMPLGLPSISYHCYHELCCTTEGTHRHVHLPRVIAARHVCSERSTRRPHLQRALHARERCGAHSVCKTFCKTFCYSRSAVGRTRYCSWSAVGRVRYCSRGAVGRTRYGSRGAVGRIHCCSRGAVGRTHDGIWCRRPNSHHKSRRSTLKARTRVLVSLLHH
jgi:hypothetical protein